MQRLVSVKRKKVVWKDYIEKIMKKKNDWVYDVKGEAIEGRVVSLSRGGTASVK